MDNLRELRKMKEKAVLWIWPRRADLNRAKGRLIIAAKYQALATKVMKYTQNLNLSKRLCNSPCLQSASSKIKNNIKGTIIKYAFMYIGCCVKISIPYCRKLEGAYMQLKNLKSPQCPRQNYVICPDIMLQYKVYKKCHISDVVRPNDTNIANQFIEKITKYSIEVARLF